MLSLGMARRKRLPDDVAELKRLLAERDAALAEARASLARKDALLLKREAAWERLKAALAWFQQRMFGRSSEKVPASVIEKMLEACAEVFGEDLVEDAAPSPQEGHDEAGEDPSSPDSGSEGEAGPGEIEEETEAGGEGGSNDRIEVKGYRRSRGGGRRDHARGLPRVELKHGIPEAERICACCGDPMEEIGAEETKLLDFLAPLFYALVHVRAKYVCRKPGCVDQAVPVLAPVPSSPLYKSVPGPGLLAHVLVSKFGDHLPLERQRKIYQRFGVDIAVGTLVRWVGKAAEFLEPLYQLLKEQVLASDILQTDDTKITVLHPSPPGSARPPEDRPEPKKARVWVYRGDEQHPYVVFDATDDWTKEGPATFLGDWTGTLQSDAYGGYDHLHGTGRVLEAGCNAHARRGFHKARVVDPRHAAQALDIYRKLYRIEKKAKQQGLGPEARLELRRRESAPVMAAFREWLDQVAPKVLPKGPMAEAIGYVRNQWEALHRFLHDGRLEIDNNASERELRQVVLGRNNWKFAGSDAGARRAVIVYSVIASAVRNGVDPLAYLRNVFTELPGLPRAGPIPKDLLMSFLPDRWAADAKAQDTLFAHVGPEVLRALSASIEHIASTR